MATSKCFRCGQITDTLAPSGLCTVCVSDTDPRTRAVEPEAATLSRDPAETASHDAADGWAGVLPRGGYKYDDEPLGEGGMGVVWRVVRESTGETFAIKKLKPESFTPTGIRRFVAEARSLVAVKHAHVVRLHDFVPDPTDPFLVLELVPGESLGTHIRNVGPLHPRRAARMIAEAAKGVDAAHKVGVVHRDLKPGNLLLTLDGRVKVADFGLCKTLGEADVPALMGATTSGAEGNTPVASGTLTVTGRLAGGTPGFMAPEQVSEDFGPVGCAADVWGLGACLHAALTTQPPFPGGKPNMGRVLTDPLVPPHVVDPRVPAELSEIVEKCLRKNPKERYPSAAAVAADLEGYLAGDGTSVRPHSWARRQWRRVQRTRLEVRVAVAVAVLAVAVGISLAMVPKFKQRDPLVEVQAKLAAGEEVVLVDEGKFLLPAKWLVGDTVLSDPTADEPYSSFASREMTLLQLLADPGIDHYRITAQVKQLPAAPGVPAPINNRISLLGAFWGYRETAVRDGWRARAFMALGFNDYCPSNLKPNPRLSHYDIGLVDSPLDSLSPVKGMGPNGPLDVVQALPGPTRTLTVDVGPDHLVHHLPGGPHRMASQVLADNCRDLERSLRGLGADPGREFGTEKWSSRAPVGVFVDRTRMAIERFVITPLPPK